MNELHPVISAEAEKSREISEKFFAHYTPRSYDTAYGDWPDGSPVELTDVESGGERGI